MVGYCKSVVIVLLVAILLSGCKDNSAGTPKAPAANPTAKDGEHGHSHERGKMLLADVGNAYHALLTAHLSPQGNELDIFFETQDDKNPTPAAIPLETFGAFVTAAGEEQAKELKFAPAPDEERPKGEKAGTCSHFVAKAPWMKPGDNLNVVVLLNLENERYRVTWENFNPKKYAHHDE